MGRILCLGTNLVEVVYDSKFLDGNFVAFCSKLIAENTLERAGGRSLNHFNMVE